MIYVYVFSVEKFDHNIADTKLTKAYLKGKGVERYSLEGFIEALNDERINIDNNWVRMIDANEGIYPISSLHTDDLEELGFDVRKVPEGDIYTLSYKLNKDYREWLYWQSLEIIADGIGIPRKKVKKSNN